MNSIEVKRRRIKGKSPIILEHELLNFKNVKKLSFKEYLKGEYQKFNWGDINNFFGNMQINEARFLSQNEWDAIEYFYRKQNKRQPIIYRIERDRYNKNFITDLFLYLNPPNKSFSVIENYGDNDLELRVFTLIIDNDLILNYDGDDLSFYIDPDKHLKMDFSNPLFILLSLISYYKKKSTGKNKIHVVYKADYGFEKMAFDVKKIKVDINLNYNDDFKDVSDYIIKNLNNIKKTGLYILDGVPGTGKTSWVRYLAGKIKRNIIFVSPDMVNYITDPAFIPFLMNNSDSILIIEDAEPALQKRDGSGRTGAISNILNLTDGLLSDCLNISIVATFNTNTKNLDDALLREGRLVKSYTFNKLASEKAQLLLNKLGHDVIVTDPMTLSEIYFYGDDNKSEQFKKRKVGFK